MNGASNDVAIAWPPRDAPWFVASYLSESPASATELETAHAEIGAIVSAQASAQGFGAPGTAVP